MLHTTAFSNGLVTYALITNMQIAICSSRICLFSILSGSESTCGAFATHPEMHRVSFALQFVPLFVVAI